MNKHYHFKFGCPTLFSPGSIVNTLLPYPISQLEDGMVTFHRPYKGGYMPDGPRFTISDELVYFLARNLMYQHKIKFEEGIHQYFKDMNALFSYNIMTKEIHTEILAIAKILEIQDRSDGTV